MAAHLSWDGSASLLYRIERFLSRWELTPVRVSVVYLLFGFAALYASDVLFVRYLDDPVLAQIQATKGAVEVVVTAGLVFALTRASHVPLQHANDQLERQREELQVLHRVLRHNLRNDLNVIDGYAEKLGDAASDSRADEWFEYVDRRVEKAVEYTEQAGRIRRVTEGNGRSQVLDLSESIPTLLDRHDHVTGDVDVDVDVPERAPVEVNQMFVEALGELVTNAVEHNDADRPSLTVSVDAGAPGITEITVSDDGPGMPDIARRVVSAGEEDQLVHLDGMGLWFVHWTVVDSGGTLAIESDERDGTTVHIQVPDAPSFSGHDLIPFW